MKDFEVKVAVGIGVLGKHFDKAMFVFRCSLLYEFVGIAVKQFSTLICYFTVCTESVTR